MLVKWYSLVIIIKNGNIIKTTIIMQKLHTADVLNKILICLVYK